MKYFSQIEQDRYFIENIIKFKKNGFFLDIGANNGINDSNTASLELYLNWTGICVEANPYLISELTINRPKSKIYNYAVWNNDTNIQLEIPHSNRNNVDGHLLSRITGLDRNNNYFKKHFKQDTELVTIEAKTITSILNQSSCLPCIIDYMSIDIEGAELEALSGIDYEQTHIKFITIEHGDRPGYIEEISKILIPKNFKIHRINQWDIEFENIKANL